LPPGEREADEVSLLQLQSGLAELGRWIDTALLVVCGVLLCVIVGIVFFEVMIRYVFNAPTAWTEETAEFMLVWYGLLTAAVGAHKGMHFSIRLAVARFNPRARWIIRQGISVAIIVFLLALLKQGIGFLEVVADQVAMGTGVNMRVPWAGIPVGVGAILAMYLLDIADAALSLWTGRQFSVREAREKEIYDTLRGATVPAMPEEGLSAIPKDDRQ
jgi:TRAP-type C4-dicarboxylate transport system permease small subunit